MKDKVKSRNRHSYDVGPNLGAISRSSTSAEANTESWLSSEGVAFVYNPSNELKHGLPLNRLLADKLNRVAYREKMAVRGVETLVIQSRQGIKSLALRQVNEQRTANFLLVWKASPVVTNVQAKPFTQPTIAELQAELDAMLEDEDILGFDARGGLRYLSGEEVEALGFNAMSFD